MRLRVLALLGLATLAGCATPASVPSHPTAPVAPVEAPLPPQPPVSPPLPKSAQELGVAMGPGLTELPGWTNGGQALALRALARSCKALMRREDRSGLTQPADWQAPCAALPVNPDDAAARRFFEDNFTAIIVGDGSGLNTGYFELELAGALAPSADFAVPLYRRPPELVDANLGDFAKDLNGRVIRGAVKDQALKPFFDRAAIEDGALAGRGLELVWAADPHEAFFLQIQGSGRVRLPDGTVLRVGYDGQNGHGYVGIGKRLREQNALAPGEATMDGIIRWLKANPEPGKALMRENKSYVFFRALDPALDGPIGALGVPLIGEVSVAADPAFVPLGAPLWLDTRHPDPADVRKVIPFARLMVAQDTGGAIKGPNRFDLFWGAGSRARTIAGALSQRGAATLLIPKSAAARLAPDVQAVAFARDLMTGQ